MSQEIDSSLLQNLLQILTHQQAPQGGGGGANPFLTGQGVSAPGSAAGAAEPASPITPGAKPSASTGTNIFASLANQLEKGSPSDLHMQAIPLGQDLMAHGLDHSQIQALAKSPTHQRAAAEVLGVPDIHPDAWKQAAELHAKHHGPDADLVQSGGGKWDGMVGPDRNSGDDKVRFVPYGESTNKQALGEGQWPTTPGTGGNFVDSQGREWQRTPGNFDTGTQVREKVESTFKPTAQEEEDF